MDPTAAPINENDEGGRTIESAQTAELVSLIKPPECTVEEGLSRDPEASTYNVDVSGSLSSSLAPAETDISNDSTASSEKSQAASDTAGFCPEPLSLLGNRALKKLGAAAFWTLAIASPIIWACLGFIGFLWFVGVDNDTWRWIVVNDHLVTVVTALSKGIETGIQLQMGVISAILAGILLEGSHVTLTDVANVSLTRWSGGVVNLLLNLWQQLSHSDRPKRVLHKPSILLLMTVAATIIAFSQVVTILLNRNLRLEPLAGFSVNGTVMYDFLSATNPGSGWNTKLSLFPTFAEYGRPGVEQTGVIDTGPCLRAFLPYPSAADRQNIHSYRGLATLIDTRVTCQKPALVDANLFYDIATSGLLVTGSVGASQHTPRLDNQTVVTFPWDMQAATDTFAYNMPVPFLCVLPTVATLDQWRTTLCSLPEDGIEGYSGGLSSEFASLTPTNLSNGYNWNVSSNSQNLGQAYLILNLTTGSQAQWAKELPPSDETGFHHPPQSYRDRQEWVDLLYSNDTLVLSITLCYTSFATANLPVLMSSNMNRTEPIPPYEKSTSSYNYDDVRRQLGQINNPVRSLSTPEERGILTLSSQRDSWVAQPSELSSQEPWLRQYFNIPGDPFSGPGFDGESANSTVFLFSGKALEEAGVNSLQADSTLVTLFQEIVTTSGGSVAFALQSLYTVMAANVYYLKMPEFDATAVVQRADFKIVNRPMQAWGFFVVLGMVICHFILLGIIVVVFFRQTRYTYLGEAWMTLAQTAGGTVVEEEILAEVKRHRGVITDKHMDEILKRKGVGNMRVRLHQRPKRGLIGDEPTDPTDADHEKAFSGPEIVGLSPVIRWLGEHK
ncbi:uncharacterized protein PV07_09895 [Cladophialophora immunda]|uniref:Uncharacterized protein n=1 Tax=Cladophialophora immunda TaxID=569365 RepID=A0A0D2C111_9EURO|nr:uncharacterized protein PV07_09895 [Cladophialophora immunda]KIW24165.1 hypothetical protein PV07_09895 [Cladophialophora immunda]OQV05316.1 hypothetical protein CLAIMM_10078 [Cladophialophora immunda]